MRRQLDLILDDLINRHANTNNGEFGGEDVVDVLLRVKDEQSLQFPIHNDNIKAVLYDIFSTGTETSSTSIDWAMVELLRNPNVMAKAEAEVRQLSAPLGEEEVHKLKYLKLVIKETLRLHPSLPMLPRASREAREIGGYHIPCGMKVMVNIWAMQRDPTFWKDPESFQPERFNDQDVDFTGGHFQFLPFGAGQRMCPGMNFGLATVELALAHLLYNFDWKLPEGVEPKDLKMAENAGITASRKDNLFVVATPSRKFI